MTNYDVYYDKHGLPITREEWGPLFADKDYQHVLRWEGEGDIIVSTVWLGIDHGWNSPHPIIFETMVFGLPGDHEYQHRYATLGEATEGHWKTVNNIIHGEPIWFTLAEITE